MTWRRSHLALLPALAWLASAGHAAAEPKDAKAPKAARQATPPAQSAQLLPTGAEDAPRAAARTAARSVESVDLEAATSRSGEGLTPVLHADGTVSLDLEGRFSSIAVAAPGAAGGYTVTCSDEAGGHGHAADAHLRSRPTAPVDARAASRAAAGTVRLPVAPAASPPAALEER